MLLKNMGYEGIMHLLRSNMDAENVLKIIDFYIYKTDRSKEFEKKSDRLAYQKKHLKHRNALCYFFISKWSFSRVADYFGYSRERIRQICLHFVFELRAKKEYQQFVKIPENWEKLGLQF